MPTNPIRQLAAYLWALPTTAVGLSIGATALITRGHMQWVDGVLEFHGGFVYPAWLLENATLLDGGALAMTLGHVVLGRTKFDLDRTRLHGTASTSPNASAGVPSSSPPTC